MVKLYTWKGFECRLYISFSSRIAKIPSWISQMFKNWSCTIGSFCLSCQIRQRQKVSKSIICLGWIPGIRIDVTFLYGRFLFPIWTDSVNQADSGDMQRLIQFPGNSDLKISLTIWNCVGCIHMCGYSQSHPKCSIFTLVIFIYKITSTYLISPWPTQFKPP